MKLKEAIATLPDVGSTSHHNIIRVLTPVSRADIEDALKGLSPNHPDVGIMAVRSLALIAALKNETSKHGVEVRKMFGLPPLTLETELDTMVVPEKMATVDDMLGRIDSILGLVQGLAKPTVDVNIETGRHTVFDLVHMFRQYAKETGKITMVNVTPDDLIPCKCGREECVAFNTETEDMIIATADLIQRRRRLVSKRETEAVAQS